MIETEGRSRGNLVLGPETALLGICTAPPPHTHACPHPCTFHTLQVHQLTWPLQGALAPKEPAPPAPSAAYVPSADLFQSMFPFHFILDQDCCLSQVIFFWGGICSGPRLLSQSGDFLLGGICSGLHLRSPQLTTWLYSVPHYTATAL